MGADRVEDELLHPTARSVADVSTLKFLKLFGRHAVRVDFLKGDPAISEGQGMNVENGVLANRSFIQEFGPPECGLDISFVRDVVRDVADSRLEIFQGGLAG